MSRSAGETYLVLRSFCRKGRPACVACGPPPCPARQAALTLKMGCPLRQKILYHFSVNIGQAVVPTCMVERQSLVVKA